MVWAKKGLDRVNKQTLVMQEKYPTSNTGLHLASTSVARVTASESRRVTLLLPAEISY